MRRGSHVIAHLAYHVLGTGTNACYLEELDRVEKWEGDNEPSKHVSKPS